MRLAVVLTVALAASACARSTEPNPAAVHKRAEVVIHLIPGGDQPRATLTFVGRSQSASVGTYCWTRPGVAQCADTTNEYLLVGSHILVPWGTVIRVVGDPEEASGRLGTVTGHTGHIVDFEPVQRLTFQGGTAMLRADPGEYTLDLFARWSGGDAALAFGIGITETG